MDLIDTVNIFIKIIRVGGGILKINLSPMTN